MRTPHQMIIATWSIATALLSTGCTGDVVSTGPGAPSAIAEVRVTPESLSVAVGELARIDAEALDSAGGKLADARLSWTTSDAAVAIVDDNGTVRAVAEGSAKLTVRGGTRSAVVGVTVIPGTVVTGVPVYPGDSIQLKVAAAPPGTQFLIKAGTHRRQTITPKDGMSFIGEPGAILDGENVAQYAFETLATLPKNVRISGLVITRYAPPFQRAAIQGDNGTGWLISDNEISYSAYEGVHPGRRAQVLRNYAHHNRVGGIAGYKSDSTLIAGNEVAFNGTTMTNEDPATAEAAGMKFMKQYGLVMRANKVHDNIRGLWIDTGYQGTILEGNYVARNTKCGIWVEATYGAIVRNNRTDDNGGGVTGGWLGHAGIQVTNSPDVEIYGNIVTNNSNGIGVMETSGYPDGPYGPLHVKNLYVHDNTITMATGVTGIAQNVSNLSVFTAWNNRFVNNTYKLGASAGYFSWNDRMPLTPAEWQGYGQDLSGTFTR